MENEVVTKKPEADSLAHQLFAVRGFSRVQIVNDDGSIAGDSGFIGPNQVTNLGFNQFVVMTLGAIAGSKQLSYVALGTGSVPGAADTTLANEVGSRTGVTAASSTGSKTLRLTATFPAGWHTNGAAYNISNIGLFNTSSGGTLFAGNTYASSSCASNQAVNVTYDLIFATA